MMQINGRAIAATEIRHSGTSYAAILRDYRPALGVEYYRFDGRWIEIGWQDMPRAAYRKIREALREDAKRGPIC